MPAICVPLEIIDAVMMAGHQAPSDEMRQADGSLIRIYADLATGTWTLFIVEKPDSTEACMMARGTDFTRYPMNTGRPS